MELVEGLNKVTPDGFSTHYLYLPVRGRKLVGSSLGLSFVNLLLLHAQAPKFMSAFYERMLEMGVESL